MDTQEWTPFLVAMLALDKALKAGNWEELEAYIREIGDIDVQDSNGYGLLHVAVADPEWRGSPRAVLELLLRRGAKTEIRTTEGETPLHFAARFDNPQAIPLLKSFGANLAARDKEGMTPLHRAASAKVVDLLLTNGGAWNAEASDGRTPLDSALARLEKAQSDDERNVCVAICECLRAAGGKTKAELAQEIV